MDNQTRKFNVGDRVTYKKYPEQKGVVLKYTQESEFLVLVQFEQVDYPIVIGERALRLEIESVAEYNGFDLETQEDSWVLKDRRSGNIAFRGDRQDLEVFLRSMGNGDHVGKFKKGDRVLRKWTTAQGTVLGYSSEPIPGLVIVRFDLGLYPIGVEGSCVHEQELELANE